MGQSLPSTFSPYGINGALVDVDKNGKFCGLRWGTNETVVFTNLVAKNDSLTIVPFGDFAKTVTLSGPADSLTATGTITFVDASGASYTFPCSVDTGRLYQDPSMYSATYTAPDVIGALGITKTPDGLTVLCDTASTPRPDLRTLTFDNAGVVGWLCQGDRFAGTISDGGIWRLWSDVATINTSSYTPYYFPQGFLLSCLRVLRRSNDPSGGNSALGSAHIEMVASNGTAYSAVYSARIPVTLGVNALFEVGWPVTVGDTSQVSNVLGSIAYWIVTGVTSQTQDFLLGSATLVAYSAPDPTSYGPPATPDGYVSASSTNGACDSASRHAWAASEDIHRGQSRRHRATGWIILVVLVLLVAGACGGAYYYCSRRRRQAVLPGEASTTSSNTLTNTTTSHGSFISSSRFMNRSSPDGLPMLP